MAAAAHDDWEALRTKKGRVNDAAFFNALA
jgi:hypothetical protein